MSRLLAAVLFVAIAAPAAAQRTGTRMGKNLEVKDIHKAMRIMAECAVDRRGRMVRAWLQTLPGSDEEDRLYKQQLDDLGLCLDNDRLVADGNEVLVTPANVRYPLALAMVRKHLRGEVTVPAVSRDVPWFSAKLAALDPTAAVDRNALGLQDFGHCVAASDWPHSRALVLSEQGSAEQAAAMSALVPVLGACLSDGINIKLNPQSLTGALAEPMAHILMSATKRTGGQ